MWFNPTQQPSPMPPLAQYPTIRIRERRGKRLRCRKFKMERQSTQKQSKTRDSFSPSHGQADIQPSPGQHGHITCNSDLGRQLLQKSPLPLSSSYFIYWTWCHVIWHIPLITWGHLSCLCLLPTSHALIVSSPGCQYENISVLSIPCSTQIQNTTPYQPPQRRLTLSQPKPAHINIFLFQILFLWRKW